MRTIDVSALQKDLPAHLDRVNEDHTPLLVTRSVGKPAIIMSLDDFNAYQETEYLMSSPKNARRLDEAMAALNRGEGTIHDLIKE
jgi:antitoxin YefM